MTVKFIIEKMLEENPEAKIGLHKFNGIDMKKRYFVPIAEALERFDGWLDEEVKTFYNGTYYCGTWDRESAETYYVEPNYILLEIW